jgi:hypothetical protein
MHSYRLERVLLVIYTRRLCRGWVMQFGEKDATSSRQGQWFSASRQRIGSRPEWIFGCSLLRKWALTGARFATMEVIKSNVTAKLRKIPKEAFRRCFQQWQDWWNKDVCAKGSYFQCDYVRVSMFYHYSAVPTFRELFDCPVSVFTWFHGAACEADGWQYNVGNPTHIGPITENDGLLEKVGTNLLIMYNYNIIMIII